MGKDKRDKLILVLLIAVILLLAFLGYLFLIRPAISNYVVRVQNEGVEYAIYTLMYQASQCPSTGVPLTYQNKTINLVALECYSSGAVN
jgi:hypothetical protein